MSEPGLTLVATQPRTLTMLDQAALWGNLGIGLLGPVTAVYVVAPGMSLLAAFTAVVAGTLIGTAGLALANAAGARTGKPAMVMLRGLFGAKLSYFPTILNLVQLLGWAVFELVVIAAAARALLPWDSDWLSIVFAGALTTLMAIRPLGVVRVLRRYALIAVTLATAYLLWRLPLPELTNGGWNGFWPGADLVIAVSVSWIPLAADYARHSRTELGAAVGSFAGYSVSQIAAYSLGLLAFSTVAIADPSQDGIFAALVAVPLGWLAFGVLAVRELDASFADVYSTAISIQNLRPMADRRVLAVIVGATATVLALVLNINDYVSFLYLLGAVFVPLFAVFVVRYFVFGGHRDWDTSADARPRYALLMPLLLGFVAYQLVNPGQISWWSRFWGDAREALHLTLPDWLSASLVSFAVAFAATLVLGRPATR